MHLYLVAPTFALLLERFCQLLTDQLDDLVLVFEPNLFLRRMNVDVDLGRINLEGEVDERMSAFGEEGSIKGFEGSFEGGTVDLAICDMQQSAVTSISKLTVAYG